MTGTTWVEESGLLDGPDRDHQHPQRRRGARCHHRLRVRSRPGVRDLVGLPVVAETYDGWLNDINGDARQAGACLGGARRRAAGGPVAEGNVGGGTGMICHEFKGGIGTSSRRLSDDDGG